MSISSALTALNQDIQNARTAIVNKGGTVTSGGGSSQLATDIATISGGGKYKLLDRVKDDSNNEIGTVSGFFTDSNGVEYAVVCLGVSENKALCSSDTQITNMPMYNNIANANVWASEETETATENTQLILDYCQSKGYTSDAATYCRGFSYVIGGVTYKGQIPNVVEATDIAKHYIDLVSTSARMLWTSNQYDASNNFYVRNDCRLMTTTKSTTRYVCPVLEIPNGV